MKPCKQKRAVIPDALRSNEKNTLQLYLSELNRFPLLSKEDEEKYARLAAQGNRAARERLVNSNLRFVISVAKNTRAKVCPLKILSAKEMLGL